MKVYLTNSRTGRLADKRIRIFREANAMPLDEAMDLVFTKDPIENPHPVTFAIWSDDDHMTFKTNDDRLDEFFDHDRSHWTNEAIQKIADEEKALWDAYANGEVFGVAVERWDANERMWVSIATTLYGCYGAKDAIENAKDFLHQRGLDACVVTCEEDCKYSFDIMKNGCDDKNV